MYELQDEAECRGGTGASIGLPVTVPAVFADQAAFGAGRGDEPPNEHLACTVCPGL